MFTDYIDVRLKNKSYQIEATPFIQNDVTYFAARIFDDGGYLINQDDLIYSDSSESAIDQGWQWLREHVKC